MSEITDGGGRPSWSDVIDRLMDGAETLADKFRVGQILADAAAHLPELRRILEMKRTEQEAIDRRNADLYAMTGCADPVEAQRMLDEWSERPPINPAALTAMIAAIESTSLINAPRRIRKRNAIVAGGGMPSRFREVVDRRRHTEWQRHQRTAR